MMNGFLRAALAACVLGGCLLSGVGVDPARAQARARRLQPSDQIQIRVLNQSELDTQARVGDDGAVTLPYVGRIKAAGRTEDDIARSYSNALKAKSVVVDAQVIVSVVNFGGQYTVLGAVRSPGTPQLDRPTKLSEAISKSGGANGIAGTIIVRRPNGRGSKLTRYDLQATLSGQGADPPVSNGDQIYVEETPVYYLYGYVNRPGAYPLQRPVTVQQALASAGGLAELGSDSRIDIKSTKNGVIEVRSVEMDDAVHANDTIIVKERWF